MLDDVQVEDLPLARLKPRRKGPRHAAGNGDAPPNRKMLELTTRDMRRIGPNTGAAETR
jgi:hypothetical protein